MTKKRIDKRTGTKRIRPPEDRKRDNAKRLTVRTEHEGLREQLPRVARASEAAKDEVASSIAAILARDGSCTTEHPNGFLCQCCGEDFCSCGTLAPTVRPVDSTTCFPYGFTVCRGKT